MEKTKNILNWTEKDEAIYIPGVVMGLGLCANDLYLLTYQIIHRPMEKDCKGTDTIFWRSVVDISW